MNFEPGIFDRGIKNEKEMGNFGDGVVYFYLDVRKVISSTIQCGMH
jgi:hypothetical protein